jgi:enediyne biosynthesis protein E4
MRLVLLTTIVVLAGIAAAAQATPAISFKDISAASGINVSHISAAENRYIIESMSGGAALFDCDGDGFLDVATVNGSSVDNYKKGGDPFLTLYRQLDGAKSVTPRFENITAAANLQRKGWGMAVTAVDLDSDGTLDLFATGYGGNAVYRGKGNCKYEDVTEKTGLLGAGFQTGAAWADYDRDGDLDLFVAGYVSLDLNNLPVFGSSQTCSYKGIRVQCGPRGLPGERDFFYRNNGDGTFAEIANTIGVGDAAKYYGLGVVFADIDNDGWSDLYVANDASPNYLYRNNKNGTFSNVSFETGASYSGAGVEQGSMGVGVGDYDNDGFFDIFVTNFEGEHNTLYRNMGSKGLSDVSSQSGVGQPSRPLVGWGTSFVDFDNDGWFDLLVANGHVYPQMEYAKSDPMTGFRQPFLLHRNIGNGKFEDISKASGLRELPMYSSRGAAFGDLNNDGLIDAVVTNLGEKPLVLMNTTRNQNSRVTISLIQKGRNRESIGSRVTLRTNRRSMIQEVQAGSSYLSQNDPRLHFGLGSGEKIDSAEVRWSDGKIERIGNIQPDSINIVVQGSGVLSSTAYRRY